MAAEKKGRSPLLPYAVLLMLCLALGIVGLMLKGKADGSFAKLEASKDEYRGMVKLRHATLVDRPSSEPAVRVLDAPWDDFQGYLAGLQSKYGIAPPQMPRGFVAIPAGPLPGGGWETRGVRIDVFGPKESPLPMRNLTLFLDELERMQPFLKSTTINLRMSGGDTVAGGDIALHYWLRKP
jgi:hypothetical protein